jgi:hypothetical protein
MQAGMELDVFTPMADGPKSVEAVANVIGVHPDKLAPLMYALVAAGLLDIREGPLFSNTEETNEFLVGGKPNYLGNTATALASKWKVLLNTAASIRTGIPQARQNYEEGDPEELERFLRGLVPLSRTNGRELAEARDFSGASIIADVGGGAGGLAIELTGLHPHLKATVVELPQVTPIARKVIAEVGAENRVNVVEADLLAGPLVGKYDAVVCRSLFQVLSREEAAQVAINIAPAVVPEGSLHVLGRMIDDSRLSPISSVSFNLDVLSRFEAGGAYTQEEHKQWLSSAGFADFEFVSLSGGLTLISGRKRS